MVKNKQLQPIEGMSEFLIYTTPNGKVRVEAFIHNENIWLTQIKIAELFGSTKQNISFHLQKIYSINELNKDSTVKKILTVQKEGSREVSRELEYYNLDAIISVGYRVNSTQATHFRIWATERLKEYIIKGFTMDDERLKNPHNVFGKDYFEEQLARIRDIRSSERRFYQKITDIYSQCSADYNKNSKETQLFFATVQNKLHWAISKQTAAEIIYSRANREKQNMGLTSWKNAPDGKVRITDVSIAKNYLNEKELNNLNSIVTMYLDYAERQANKYQIMYMKDWISKLDTFLQFNEEEVLTNAGKITAEIAKTFAENEFEKYQVIQDRLFESDFDKLIKLNNEDEH
ncbi:MAG: hypothetical protein K0R14_442 [Burkholderiales bacterium]|jgi:hypothetical protein|nr:hypothetical protein [Burkholderiales bacterium]